MFSLVHTVYAADPSFDGILSRLSEQIINPLIMLAFAVAVVVFMWGLFKLIKGGDDPGVRETAQQHVLWGVIGMFIMFSAYGILNFVLTTIGVQ